MLWPPEELHANLRTWIDQRRIPKLAAFLSLNSETSVNLLRCAADGRSVLEAYKDTCRQLPPPWNDIIKSHLQVLDAVASTDFAAAANAQIELISVFRARFLDHGTKASLPMLYAILETLSVVAMAADEDAERQGNDTVFLETSMGSFRGAFSSCISDSLGTKKASKRWGALRITNIIFKILIKLLKPDLMAKQMANLEHQFGFGESTDLTSLGHFHRSDFVTYKYYTALIGIFDDDYRKADVRFTFALRQIADHSRKNRLLVLIYLIPLRMCRGQLPSAALLAEYDELRWLYGELVDSIRLSDLRLFNRVLPGDDVLAAENETAGVNGTTPEQQRIRLWEKKGLFDLIVSLRWLVLRGMMKRLWKAKGSPALLNADIQLAYAYHGQQISPEEIRYQMAQLLAMNLMIGNVQAGGVVLSKKEPPFPPISDQLQQYFSKRDLWQG
ncbi:COP9 signalosome (CSN) subunit [Sorochytrium milnesiophthora]